jgi:hypothetical protein
VDDKEPVDDQDDIGLGLSEGELQAMAKRQFAASIAAAIVIALGAALAALAPASRDHGQIAAHRSLLVQQPTMIIAPEHGLASRTQAEIEVP